jgi:hypothetical protein
LEAIPADHKPPRIIGSASVFQRKNVFTFLTKCHIEDRKRGNSFSNLSWYFRISCVPYPTALNSWIDGFIKFLRTNYHFNFQKFVSSFCDNFSLMSFESRFPTAKRNGSNAGRALAPFGCLGARIALRLTFNLFPISSQISRLQ